MSDRARAYAATRTGLALARERRHEDRAKDALQQAESTVRVRGEAVRDLEIQLRDLETER